MRSRSWPEARDIRELVRRANQVGISKVLRDFLGTSVPDDTYGSFKTKCPFGWEHEDGGLDPGFRVYSGTNSSYCFVMHGSMNPVRLVQEKDGTEPLEAAQKILERYGLPTSTDYRERFAELVAERERAQDDLGDTSSLVEALNAALGQDDRYAERQYDADVQSAFEEELERLDGLLTSGEADRRTVREWYESARERLRSLL